MARYCPRCEDPVTTTPTTAEESVEIATGVHPAGPPLVITSEPEHCPKCGEPVQDKM